MAICDDLIFVKGVPQVEHFIEKNPSNGPSLQWANTMAKQWARHPWVFSATWPKRYTQGLVLGVGVMGCILRYFG